MLPQTKRIWCVIAALILYASRSLAQCYNGDVEANNFTNWTGWTGANVKGTVNIPAMSLGLAPGRHTIMTPGNDPVLAPLGVNLPRVAEGNYSIRLGNQSGGSQADMISYTFTVTNLTLYFRYAMVMQAPMDHRVQDRPFFYYIIAPGGPSLSRAAILASGSKKVIASTTDPFFRTANPGAAQPIVYKGWQTECLRLPFIWYGRTITMYFLVADCALDGHYGYMYIDGICKPASPVPDFTYPSVICKADELWVDGTPAQNAKDHYWKIEQLSSSSITSVIPGTAHQVTYLNQPPGYIANILTTTALKAYTYPPGYYKLTLGARNCSSGWVEKSVVVQIKAPDIATTEFFFRCCSDPFIPTLSGSVPIVNPSNPGTFSWYDHLNTYLGSGTVSVSQSSSGFLYTSIFNPPSNITGKYKIVYVAPSGCVSEKWVWVINRKDFTPRIVTNERACRDATKLTAMLTIGTTPCDGTDIWGHIYAGLGPYTYSWSTGETTQSINVRPGTNVYSVTVSNGCYAHTVTVDLSVKACSYIAGPVITPTHFRATTAMKPGSSTARFRVYDARLTSLGATPAYSATRYELYIVNRYGQKMHYVDSTTCGGFGNGDIIWDGQIDGKPAGTYVELGTYYYWLKFYNCYDGSDRIFKGDFHAIY